MGLAIFNHLGSAGECLAELVDSPRGDHLNIGSEGGVGDFKAALVVALAGRAVGDVGCALLAGDFDLRLGDERAGNGGSQIVLALVNRVCADHRIDEVGDEFVLQVDGVVGGSPRSLGFFGEAVQLLLLPDIGGKRNHLCIEAVFDPLDDNGGVKTPRIC